MHRHRLFLALVALLGAAPVAALDTTLTYQGALTDAGAPANGSYDLQFTLLDSRGLTIGPVLLADNVAVTSGLFSVELDFGPTAFTGAQRTLRIGVRAGARTDPFTTLAPEVKINPTPYAQLAGDALIATTVADDAIVSAKIADGTITGADVLDNTLGSGDLGANSVGSSELADQSVAAIDIADGSIAAAELANGSVTNAKLALASVTSDRIADGAIAAAALANGSVTNAKLAVDSVTSDRIATGTIVDADIAGGTILGVSIADETISASNIGPGQVGASEIAASAVTASELAAGAVTSVKIADGTIVPADAAATAFWMPGGNAGTTPASHYLGTSDGQALRLQAGGGVGINTTSPQAQLHVAHNPAFAEDEVARFARADNTATVKLKLTSGRPRLEFNPDSGTKASIEALDGTANGTGTTSLDFSAGFVDSNALPPMRLMSTITLGGAFTRLSLNPQFSGVVVAEKPGGGSWSAPSDRRLKHAVEPLDGALDHLLELRGVTFVYNDAGKGRYPAGVQTGFVAQEVQRVFPGWVEKGPDGYLLVGSKGFEALTVEALRDLRAEKDVEIESLREENAELQARLDRLEARLTPR